MQPVTGDYQSWYLIKNEQKRYIKIKGLELMGILTI